MYAKVGATSTSIHLNKVSMQHSPTHWNSKNYEKRGLKTHLRGLIFQNFLTQGKGTSLPLDPIPAQTRPYGPRCGCHSILQISPPPPFQFLCTPLYPSAILLRSHTSDILLPFVLGFHLWTLSSPLISVKIFFVAFCVQLLICRTKLSRT